MMRKFFGDPRWTSTAFLLALLVISLFKSVVAEKAEDVQPLARMSPTDIEDALQVGSLVPATR